MKDDIKDTLKQMHEMGYIAENCISLLQAAFIYNSAKVLKDCAAGEIKKAEPELTRKITEIARERPDYRPYVSIPGHFLRIAENIEKLAELIDKKIKDRVLFSDKAVTEITFLLQRLVDVLRPASDIILAKNVFLSRYVLESEIGIEKRAMEFTNLHEERLIEGLCLPPASAIYINMLDAIKGIAWHSREIASKLVGWMLPKA